MKLIPLSEAKTHLSRYAKMCHKEVIVVTVNGVPSFQLLPLEEDDDLIDRLLEYNPQFGKFLQGRLNEQSVPVKSARRRL